MAATALLLFVAAPKEASAQTTYYWDSNGATAGFGNTTGTWGTSAFWSTDAAGTSATANSTITTSDTVNFGTATLNYANATVTGPATAQGFQNMSFGANQTTALTISGGTLNLAANSTITQNSAAAMTISSVLQGSGSALTKNGTGALTLSGNNTFSGGVTVLGTGTLTLQNSNAAGTGTISLKTSIANTSSALLVSGGITVANAIQSDSAAGRQNISSSGTGNNTLSGGITITGSGTIPIIQNNQSSGTLTISGGITGTTYNGTVSLRGILAGNVGFLNGPVTLTGGTGATLEHQGTSNWTLNTAGSTYALVAVRNAGSFILAAHDALATGARIDFLSGNSSIGGIDLNGYNQTVTGIAGIAPITGNGGIITNSGTSNSMLTLNGTTNRTYFGTITDGPTNKISLTKAGSFTQTLNGNSTFSGDTLVSAGTLALGSNLAIQNSAIDTSGSGNVTLASGVTTPTIGGLSGSKNLSSVITGNYTAVTSLTLNPGTGVTKTYSGNITNGAAGMTLTKTGNGTQVLSGTNTYTGTTTVSAGTLLINGSTSASSAVNVSSGATLGGNGTVGGSLTVASGATLAPGNSPGILSSGDLSFSGNLSMELNGVTVGTQYDQVNVTGTVSLVGGNTLTLSLGYTPTDGTNFFLINNDGSDAITGLLAGYAQDAVFSLSGQQWKIGYTGDSGSNSFTGGNDLVLQAVPEPATWALFALSLTTVTILRRRRS